MTKYYLPWGSMSLEKANRRVEEGLFKCDILNKQRAKFEAATHLLQCFKVHK